MPDISPAVEEVYVGYNPRPIGLRVYPYKLLNTSRTYIQHIHQLN